MKRAESERVAGKDPVVSSFGKKDQKCCGRVALITELLFGN